MGSVSIEPTSLNGIGAYISANRSWSSSYEVRSASAWIAEEKATLQKGTYEIVLELLSPLRLQIACHHP